MLKCCYLMKHICFFKVIVSLLSVPSIFCRPKGREDENVEGSLSPGEQPSHFITRLEGKQVKSPSWNCMHYFNYIFVLHKSLQKLCMKKLLTFLNVLMWMKYSLHHWTAWKKTFRWGEKLRRFPFAYEHVPNCDGFCWNIKESQKVRSPCDNLPAYSIPLCIIC